MAKEDMKMTMTEKLRIHAEIEAADRQHRDEYIEQNEQESKKEN